MIYFLLTFFATFISLGIFLMIRTHNDEKKTNFLKQQNIYKFSLMKDKFINKCKVADLIEMNGIILRYLPSSNELCYRVLGEFNYLALNDLEDSNFGYDGVWHTIKRGNALFKFKFYTEIKNNG